MKWLAEHLSKCPLAEETLEYLLSRGAKTSSIQELGLRTWTPLAEDSPEETFSERYGRRGKPLAGHLAFPVYSPKGTFLGFEARSTREKRVTDFRTAEASWNPFFLGMPRAMKRIWLGGNVWIVEGVFDLLAMEWVVPETDAILATFKAGMSQAHIEFLRRFVTGMVNMVYDQDDAGQRATHGWHDGTKKYAGALEKMSKVGLKCRALEYHGGKDPGVLWDSYGAKGLKETFSRYL